MSISIRRKLKAKKKLKIEKILKHRGQCTDLRTVGIYARTPARCSCYMCGNRRKTSGRSIQERRSDLNFGEYN